MNINTIQTADIAEPAARISQTAVPRGGVPAEQTPLPDNVRSLDSVEVKNRREDSKGQDGPLSKDEMQELVEALNEYMDDFQTNLGFSIRDDLDRQVIVEIKNRETDELVKQIPSEELLKIMENMKELTGIIFDQSV